MDETLLEIPGVSVLRVAGTDAEGTPLVEAEGGGGTTPALAVWMRDEPDWQCCRGLRVVVAIPDGDGSSPVILGLLDPPPDPVDRVESRGAAAGKKERKKERRMHIESEEELVIECGKAKITLRADGRIEIRGGHLVSRSSGPNKIKGATVHIN
jgi:hypothetical protein